MNMKKYYWVIISIVVVIVAVLPYVKINSQSKEISNLKKEITYLKTAKIEGGILNGLISSEANNIVENITTNIGIKGNSPKFSTSETRIDGFHVYVNMYLSGHEWQNMNEAQQKSTLTEMVKAFTDLAANNSDVRKEDIKININIIAATSGEGGAAIFENGNINIYYN